MTIRFLTRFLLFAACASALLCSAPMTQAAAPESLKGGGVVLQPSDTQGTEISTPGYFQVTAAPGQSTTLYALVGNVQQQKVGIELVPVDARSGVYGGVSYNLPQQRRTMVGAWITLSKQKVSLKSQQARVVTVVLRVPPGVRPGQYVGGLTAFVPTPTAAKTTSKKSGAIQLQLRRVVAVVVTVPGPSVSRFTIGSAKPKQRPDAVYIITHIHNTGTVLLKGKGHLWVWRVGVKKPIISVVLSIDTTLPRTTVHYPILWSRHPQKGAYTYTVSLNWDGGTVSKSGKFVVGK